MNIWDVVLWREFRVTAIVCFAIFVLLVCLTQYSVVSIFTNSVMLLMLPLLVLKLLLKAKSACLNAEFDHPLKSVLPQDINIPKHKADQYGEEAAKWIQKSVAHISRLLLVEDLAHSVMVFAALYILSYLSQWFSGISLLFIGFVGLFTIPKIYDLYKEEIRNCVSKIQNAINKITSTITAKFPSRAQAAEKTQKNKDKEKKS